MVSAGLSAPTASGAGIAASTLSPAASYEIGQYFKSKDAEGSAAHILAHTILGAAVAATGGNNALTAGIAAGGAEAAAPLLSQYLYGKEAKDLTASEKSTISSIVGLAGTAVGAITGDVSSTVQSGQSAQNAVENNYQTKATLRVVNKQLQKCSPSDRGCIERGISALRKADKILDNHFKTCAQTKDASCVKNHLEQILASDASPEMKETIQLLKQLGISTETMGLLNETSGYSQKETQLVEDARAGKDLGCISGTTQNCIAPISEKTLGGKVGTVINDMTVRQLAAVMGAEYDPLTREKITPNEREDAKAAMLGLGFSKTLNGPIILTKEVLTSIEKKYGSQVAKYFSQKAAGNSKVKIENNFYKDDDFFTDVSEKMAFAKKNNWKTSEGRTLWPPNDGIVPNSQFQTTLPVGAKLDRFGGTSDKSSFLAPVDVPLDARALSPATNTKIRDVYEVVKPLPVVQSKVMPWFDKKGMGIQYETIGGIKMTVKELVEQGYLRKVKK